METLRISVVIPARNRAATLGYCLDSVVNQTCPPFEVLVVDDGSTDDTVARVQQYGHPNVRVIVPARSGGAQAARNHGIRQAKGDWIAFQDSDDAWDPHKLEKQVAALGRYQFDPFTLVHSDCYRYYPHLQQREVWSLPPVEGEDVYATLLGGPAPVFPTFLTSKKALEAIGLLDEGVPSYQEWDTAIRLAKVCRFVHLREPLFIYYLHQGETISKNMSRDVEGYHYIRLKHKTDTVALLGEKFYQGQVAWNIERAMELGLWTTARVLLQKDQDLAPPYRRRMAQLLWAKIKPSRWRYYRNKYRKLLNPFARTVPKQT